MEAKDKKRDYIFIALLLIVHIAVYILALHFKKICNDDSHEYVDEAVNIKDHFLFYCGSLVVPIKAEYMTLRPPLYPLFMMSVYVFVINNWVVFALQNLLSVFNILCIRDTMLRLGFNKRYDWVYFLFVIMYPVQFTFSNFIAADILFQTFAVLYFRKFVLLESSKNWKNALWMSVVLVAGAMVKPVFYPFCTIHIILLLVMAYRQKVTLINAAAVILLPVCLILLYNTWNFSRTGKFHFSSIEAINPNYNIWEYNNSKLGYEEGNRIYHERLDKIAAVGPYSARYDTAVSMSGRFIKEHLVSYAAYHLMHTARIFIEPGKAELDMFTGKLTLAYLGSNESVDKGFYATVRKYGWRGVGAYVQRNPSLPYVLLIFVFNLLRLIGFLLFVFGKRVPLPLRLFVMLYVGYFALAAGPVANTHYFLPVSLVVIGCAVSGFAGWIEKRNTSLSSKPAIS